LFKSFILALKNNLYTNAKIDVPVNMSGFTVGRVSEQYQPNSSSVGEIN